MYTYTEGVPRDCWEEVATWAGMPELIVDMSLEVEIDVLISKPMNAVFYQAREGRPCGFVVDELVEHVHDTWRPLMERLEDNPLSEIPHTAAAIRNLDNADLQVLKTKQVSKHHGVTYYACDCTCTHYYCSPHPHIIVLFFRCALPLKLQKKSSRKCMSVCMKGTCYFCGCGILPFVVRLRAPFAVSSDWNLARVWMLMTKRTYSWARVLKKAESLSQTFGNNTK